MVIPADTHLAVDLHRRALIKTFTLCLGGLSLFIAFAVALLQPRELPYFVAQATLASMLDTVEVTGWRAENKALGDSEFQAARVSETLRFDDAVYRVYRRGEVEVGVYIAYWKPGKLDPWLIALHTPDSCWVLAGATMSDRNDERKLGNGQFELRPGNFRRFRWPSTPSQTEVVFWHLYGGKPSGFPVTGVGGRWRGRWEELLLTLRNTQWGRVKKEQVLVRVSTNRSVEELVSSDLWPALVNALEPIGIVSERYSINERRL